MNRGSNVLNAELLGASSGSAFVFMSATLICSAQSTVHLRLHHLLKCSLEGAGSFTSKLSAGRQLKGAVAPQALATGVLTKALPKTLQVTASASAVATVNFSSVHVTYLKANRSAIADFTSKLSSRTAKKLAVTSSMVMGTEALLRRCTTVRLTTNTSMVASCGSKLYAGRLLKPRANTYQANIRVTLMESSHIRAPSGRIIYVPYDNRTVFVLGAT